MKRPRNSTTILCGIIIFVLLVSGCGARREATFTVIDVGQGDSILIQAPDGKNCLIDGGGSGHDKEKTGSSIVLPFLRRKGINKLDLVVLTHPHDDHASGLVPVIREMKTDRILDSGCECKYKEYNAFLRTAKEKGIKIIKARAGEVISFGAMKGYVLAPYGEQLSNISNYNNVSIVIRFVFGKRAFLFTGDCNFEEENIILAHGSFLKSDFLKVGHHGSATSTSDEFLDRASPKAAAISVGANNTFGHPADSLINRLQARRIRYFRTDRNGAVTVRSDGEKIWIDTVR